MATKKYLVGVEFNAQYNVVIEAESKKEAEVIVRKNINFNLGELENNDSLEGVERTSMQSELVKD